MAEDILRLKLERYEEAIKDYDKAIEFNSNNMFAIQNRSDAIARLRDLDRDKLKEESKEELRERT